MIRWQIEANRRLVCLVGDPDMNNGKPLEGKVAIVTGASRGIGLAVAHRLGTLGAKLSLCARDARKLESAADELRPVAAGVFSAAVDVKHGEQILAFVQNTEKALGPVAILVNNAGVGYFGPTHEATEANWDSVLDTNLKAVFLASKAGVPGMMERRGGDIINILVLAGEKAVAGRRDLLCFEMGAAGIDGVHGGGFAGVWDTGKRDMSWKRGYGFFAAREEGYQQDVTARGYSACGGDAGDAGAAEFYQ